MNTHDVPARVRAGSPNPMTSMDGYKALYEEILADPDGYWVAETTRRIAWRDAPSVGLSGSFATIADAPIRWFEDGTLNVTESCICLLYTSDAADE